MRLPSIALMVTLGAVWTVGWGARAAQPPSGVQPSTLPLLSGLDMRYLGRIPLPDKDVNDIPLTYGGHALGVAPDGRSLYYSCIYSGGLARVSLPEPGSRGEILEPCQEFPNLEALDPDDPNAKILGGVLAWNGRLVFTGYAVYDAGRVVTKSHWVGKTIAGAQGPYEVGDELPGLVAGYMSVVPEEWRALFGGPALTGQCCISIISRSSFGPSVSVFDPDQVGGRRKAPATMLVGYPDEHQGLGPYDYPGNLWSSVVLIGGVAFPSGTRSVLFIGRHGPGYCYGEGTKDPALHGKPHPSGTLWCHDPTNADKGAHGFPYRHMVWAYDANDLVAVKQRKKDPWDVRPYATWTLPEMTGGTGDAWMNGAVYDPIRRRIYVVPKNDAVLHVYEVGKGSSS